MLYLGGVAVIFLLGLGSGLAASGWWSGTPGPPTLVFVTAPPGPSPAALAGTPQTGSDLCPPPAGWITYTIQPGDTLLGLADQFNTGPELIQQANCLPGSQLLAGQTLFLPPVATPTPCATSAPVGWGSYTVQSGDTLYALASARGTTVAALIQVNCLPSESIAVGDTLSLPALPTSTPTPLPPPTPVPTPLPPTPVSVASIPTPAPTASIPTPAPTVSIPTLAPIVPAAVPTTVVPRSPFSLQGSIPKDLVEPSDSNKSGELEYVPCTETKPITAPWVSAFDNDEQVQLTRVALGQRRYFFLCNFKSPPATALVTRSDSITYQLEIRSILDLPNPELKRSITATHFVEWLALPFYPTSSSTYSSTLTYTLTIKDDNGNLLIPTQPFRVISPSTATPYIMPVPLSGPPGTSFLVYYVNFPLWQAQEFQLYYYNSNPNRQTDTRHVLITEPLTGVKGKGWGLGLLPSIVTDVAGTYVISSTNPADSDEPIHQKIWLTN